MPDFRAAHPALSRRLRSHSAKYVFWTAAVILILIAADLTFLAVRWPFRRRAVIESLSDVSDANVEIRQFRKVFFPRPGCVAEDVIIHRPSDPSGPPLIRIHRMEVFSDYFRMVTFNKDLHLIRTDGMQIQIRTDGAAKASRSGSHELGAKLTIDRLVADNSVLEFTSGKPGKKPYTIAVHHVGLAPVSGHTALTFDVDLRLPAPAGEIRAGGQFGPWNRADPFGTPASGSYTFEHADLAFARGIAGTLESKGEFHGPLRHIAVTGAASVPNFEVTSVRHVVPLSATFRAIVNGKTGDTVVKSVRARVGKSEINGSLEVASPEDGEPKTVELELGMTHGRIEDFLRLLSGSPRPGMTGNLALRTKIHLPPKKGPFLKQLELSANFSIRQARFTSQQTEQSLDQISQGAKQSEKNPEAPLSNLSGQVVVRGGTAHLENVTFEDPGASAHVKGTYNLITTRLDLSGTAHLERKLSKTQTGIKSVLLKIVDPFFKSRKHEGADVPIRITGTGGNFSVGIDLGKKF